MTEDTYNASGYKFGLLIVPKKIQRYEIDLALADCESFEELTKVYRQEILKCSDIVDFNSIDGITFQELYDFDVFNKDYLFFVVYNQICLDNFKTNMIVFTELIEKSVIKDMEQATDDFFANYLIEKYNFRDAKTQKYIRVFLERYKYPSKEKVDKVLRLNNNKK